MMFPAVVLKLHKLIYNSFQPTLWMLLAILILFSQTIATTTPVKTDLDQVSLALKWKHQFQFAGYYAAVEKGFLGGTNSFAPISLFNSSVFGSSSIGACSGVLIGSLTPTAA